MYGDGFHYHLRYPERPTVAVLGWERVEKLDREDLTFREIDVLRAEMGTERIGSARRGAKRRLRPQLYYLSRGFFNTLGWICKTAPAGCSTSAAGE
jgi:hypothetical protein